MLVMKPYKSPNYLFTYQPNDPRDDAIVQDLRDFFRQVNASGFLGRYRVSFSARLGKANPYHWKYQNRFRPRLRLEDAAFVDVYCKRVEQHGALR